MLRYIPSCLAAALLINQPYFDWETPFPVIILLWMVVVYSFITVASTNGYVKGLDDLVDKLKERTPLLVQESANLAGTTQPDVGESVWVMEHRANKPGAINKFPEWHWFPDGSTGKKAACGRAAIPGMPFVSRQKPRYLTASELCEDCRERWLAALEYELESA